MEVWRLKIIGHVQGVGFRYSVMRFVESKVPSIRGHVKNCADYSVEVLAIGEVDQLTELKAFCRTGPRRAEVTELILEKEDLKLADQFGAFVIR